MEQFLTYVIPVLTTLLGYMGGNYKRKKNEEALYITNLNESLKAYNQVILDMKERYDEEIKRLTEKCEGYEKMIKELKDKIDLLEKNN
jgi:predicted  nucleic acid-binding Zn-ribbon protein